MINVNGKVLTVTVQRNDTPRYTYMLGQTSLHYVQSEKSWSKYHVLSLLTKTLQQSLL